MTAEGGRRPCGHTSVEHVHMMTGRMAGACDYYPGKEVRPAAQPSESEREGACWCGERKDSPVHRANKPAWHPFKAESPDVVMQSIDPDEWAPEDPAPPWCDDRLCKYYGSRHALPHVFFLPPSPPSTGQSREQRKERGMKRAEVYGLIDGERDYQNQRWGSEHDAHESIGGFLVYMDEYLRRAKSAATDATTAADPDTMAGIRKIAALAVACMERFGAPARR
jgi:hypothetical protein